MQHGDFVRWNTSNDTSSPLWISGQPGMGKTVISKFLLGQFESSRESPRHKAIYFFFSNQDESRKTAISFLTASIHQFIQLSSRLFRRYVKIRLLSFGDDVYTSFGLLWDIFLDMARDTSLGRVYCILDALDECEPRSRSELISYMGRHLAPPTEASASEGGSGGFKLVVTSRPYDDILASWSRFHIIHLRAESEEPLINEDIAILVESEVERLARLRNYSANLKEQVQDALINGADGMFLWVVLMVKVLESTPITRVSDRLKKLPNGIDALYDRVLAEIPEGSMETISTILKWAVFALRPLTVEELGIACAIDGASYVSLESIPPEIRHGIQGDLGLCVTLLKVKNDSVYLFHQTTKEYLLRRSSSETVIDRLLLPPQEAHARMALTCLIFLDFPELNQLLRRQVPHTRAIDRKLPFLHYARYHWGSHVRESGPITENTDLCMAMLVVLLSAPKRAFLEENTQRERVSNEYVNGVESDGGEDSDDVLQEGDRDIKGKHGDKDNGKRLRALERAKSRGPHLSTPLHLLIGCGCESAAEVFARTQRFQIRDQDRVGRLTLHMAAGRGYTRLVQILLAASHDADLEQTLAYEGSGRGRSSRHYTQKRTSTALHLAAAEGHEGVVRVLLEKHADPNSEDTLKEFYEINSTGGTTVRRTRTALHLATTRNHKAVVRLLLDSSAQVDAMETRLDFHQRVYGTPAIMAEQWSALHIANTLRYTDIRDLLLERGASVVVSPGGETSAPYELDEEGDEFTRRHYDMNPQWEGKSFLSIQVKRGNRVRCQRWFRGLAASRLRLRSYFGSHL